MEIPFEDALERIQVLGAKLSEQGANRNASHEQIAATLSEYRRACTSALHANYAEAIRWNVDGNVEEKLWTAHSQINTRFRKDMHESKRRRQNNVVEIRKLAKPYADFLKSSQRFYRAYIYELDLYHGGITELRKVARKLEPQEAGTGASIGGLPDADTRKKLVLSCYHSLNHLGDLSRYRETECSTDPPKWGPAVGYYNLAIEIYPHSGLAYNQLAVIALADSSHLRAIYYLYRSLAVLDPYPLGQGNLEIEFKKVTTAWDKGELIKHDRSRDGSASNKALVAWFVRLHSKCYLGKDFAGHRELEDEVLGQMTQAIKQRFDGTLLRRFVLTNISAEWFAAKRIKGSKTPPETVKSFQFYLQLNIRTFTTLLQILLDELQRSASTGDNEEAGEINDKVSLIARCTLPAIRLYSYWLTEQATILSANVADPSLRHFRDEMWRVYAAVLTKGVADFLDQGVPGAEYLFEEDADVVGFLPLVTKTTEKHWYSKGNPKPRFSDDDVQQHHPTKEALIRLKDLVIGGAELLSGNKNGDPAQGVPLVYENFHFFYKADYDLTKSLEPAAQKTESTKEPTHDTIMEDAPRQDSAASDVPPPIQESSRRSRTKSGSTSVTTSVTKDASMNRMVDALVGDDEGLDALPEEEQDLPVTPPANFEDAPMVRNPSSTIAPLTASDLVQQVQNWGQSKTSISQAYSSQGPVLSPFVKNAPSPRQHPDPWVRPPLGSGPTSPAQAAAPHMIRYPSGDARSSHHYHARGASATSLRPLQTDLYRDSLSATRPSTAHTITPLPPPANQFEELRQVWGVMPNVPTAELVRQRQPRYGEPGANAMTSSMLFGAGGGPWSAGAEKSSGSYGNDWSPMNGQGG